MYTNDDLLAQYQGFSATADNQDITSIETSYNQNLGPLTQPNSAPAFDEFDNQEFVPIAPPHAYVTYSAQDYTQQWFPNTGVSSMDADKQDFHSNPNGVPSLSHWPSITTTASRSDDDGGAMDEESPDRYESSAKKKERRERRRAQNRVAQRLFRARREVSLKENSQRLENLEDEVARLQTDNEDLTDTINSLKKAMKHLKKENSALRRRVSESADEDECDEEEDPSIVSQTLPQKSSAHVTESQDEDGDTVEVYKDTPDTETTAPQHSNRAMQQTHNGNERDQEKQ